MKYHSKYVDGATHETRVKWFFPSQLMVLETTSNGSAT